MKECRATGSSAALSANAIIRTNIQAMDFMAGLYDRYPVIHNLTMVGGAGLVPGGRTSHHAIHLADHCVQELDHRYPAVGNLHNLLAPGLECLPRVPARVTRAAPGACGE